MSTSNTPRLPVKKEPAEPAPNRSDRSLSHFNRKTQHIYLLLVMLCGGTLLACQTAGLLPEFLQSRELEFVAIFIGLVLLALSGIDSRMSLKSQINWLIPSAWLAFGYCFILVICHISVAFFAGMNRVKPVEIIGFIGLSTVILGLLFSTLAFGRSCFRKFTWYHGCCALLLVLPCFVLSHSAIGLLPENSASQNWEELEKEIATTPLIIVLAFVSVFPAVGEELFFRGFIGRGLISRYGIVSGVITTSLLFALVHLNPMQIVTAFLLGIVIHIVYLSSGSMWLPMLLHAAINAIGVLESRKELPNLKDITPHPLNEGPPSTLFLVAMLMLGVGAIIVLLKTSRFQDLEFLGAPTDKLARGTKPENIDARSATSPSIPTTLWIGIVATIVGVCTLAGSLLSAKLDDAGRLAFGLGSVISNSNRKLYQLHWSVAEQSAEVRMQVFDHFADAPEFLNRHRLGMDSLIQAIVGTDPRVRTHIADTYVRTKPAIGKNPKSTIAGILAIDGAVHLPETPEADLTFGLASYPDWENPFLSGELQPQVAHNWHDTIDRSSATPMTKERILQLDKLFNEQKWAKIIDTLPTCLHPASLDIVTNLISSKTRRLRNGVGHRPAVLGIFDLYTRCLSPLEAEIQFAQALHESRQLYRSGAKYHKESWGFLRTIQVKQRLGYCLEQLAHSNSSKSMARLFEEYRLNPELCKPKQLMRLLKYPQCTDLARAKILEELEQHTAQKFGSDLWTAIEKHDASGLTIEDIHESASRALTKDEYIQKRNVVASAVAKWKKTKNKRTSWKSSR